MSWACLRKPDVFAEILVAASRLTKDSWNIENVSGHAKLRANCNILQLAWWGGCLYGDFITRVTLKYDIFHSKQVSVILPRCTY